MQIRVPGVLLPRRIPETLVRWRRLDHVGEAGSPPAGGAGIAGGHGRSRIPRESLERDGGVASDAHAHLKKGLEERHWVESRDEARLRRKRLGGPNCALSSFRVVHFASQTTLPGSHRPAWADPSLPELTLDELLEPPRPVFSRSLQ